MKEKIVVTGGGGFLGQALCRRLVALGYEVHSLARGSYPELERLGVRAHAVDLTTPADSWREHLSNASAVFHVAAKVDLWGRYRDFFAANVKSTRSLLAACRAQNVARFIYTSSPSAFVDGRPLVGCDETYPYPRTHLSYYGATKAIADREVLAANGSQGLLTVVLRPHMVWGPGPTTVLLNMQRMAREGRLVVVGQDRALTDLCYVEDAVDAHVLALERLAPRSAIAGQAYFISQGEPLPFFQFVESVVTRSGLEYRPRRVPYPAAAILAAAYELTYRAMQIDRVPPLTRYLLFMATKDHYFDIRRARRDLGFQPRIDLPTGLDLTFAQKDQRHV